MKAIASFTITDLYDGTDGTISSNNPPEDTSKLWLNTSETPPVLMAYDGEQWVVVNDNKDDIDNAFETITTNYESYINQTVESLTTEFKEETTTISNNLTTLESKVGTFEETVNGFGGTYVSQESYSKDKEEFVTTSVLTRYFNYDATADNNHGELIIGYNDGTANSSNEIRMGPNSGFSIYESGNRMIFMTQSQTYVKNLIAEGSFQLGTNGLRFIDEGENGWSITI